jgi:hypothetical protein
MEVEAAVLGFGYEAVVAIEAELEELGADNRLGLGLELEDEVPGLEDGTEGDIEFPELYLDG